MKLRIYNLLTIYSKFKETSYGVSCGVYIPKIQEKIMNNKIRFVWYTSSDMRFKTEYETK
jgi:hypothetical protein